MCEWLPTTQCEHIIFLQRIIEQVTKMLDYWQVKFDEKLHKFTYKTTITDGILRVEHCIQFVGTEEKGPIIPFIQNFDLLNSTPMDVWKTIR